MPESRKSLGGSGEKKTSIAAAPVAPRSPSSSSWRGRRRSARGTRSPGSPSALAASSHGGERRMLSGNWGKRGEGSGRSGDGGEVREGVEGVSVAHFGVLGRPGRRRASRCRRRGHALLQRAAWLGGEEDDKPAGGLGRGDRRWASPGARGKLSAFSFLFI